MSKFKKIFKSKIFKTVAPLAVGLIPGVGPLAGAALGAGIGAVGGGGIKGALLGGAGGFVGAGGLGKVAGTALGGGLTGPTQGSGILGSLTRGSGFGSSLIRGASSLGRGATSGLFGGGSSGGSGIGGGLGNLLTNAIGGLQSNAALKDARNYQLNANSQALRGTTPFLNTGIQANQKLGSLLGLNGENPDDILDQLRQTPGYQFNLDEGNRAIDRSLASRGSFFSGRAIKEGQRFGQGLADQTYNDYANRLAQQSGQGANSANFQSALLGNRGDIQGNYAINKQDILNRSLANILQPRL